MTDEPLSSDHAATRASRRILDVSASRRSRRVKAGFFIFLMVLAGAVIGAGGAVMYFKREMYRRPPRPHDLGRVIVETLDGEVGLTEPERTVLREQMDRLMAEVEVIRSASFAAIQGKFDESNAKLRALLGKERYRKWEEYKKEHFPRRRGKRDRK